jgi:hypothetical protein
MSAQNVAPGMGDTLQSWLVDGTNFTFSKKERFMGLRRKNCFTISRLTERRPSSSG